MRTLSRQWEPFRERHITFKKTLQTFKSLVLQSIGFIGNFNKSGFIVTWSRDPRVLDLQLAP